jgi:hypothetical protein
MGSTSSFFQTALQTWQSWGATGTFQIRSTSVVRCPTGKLKIFWGGIDTFDQLISLQPACLRTLQYAELFQFGRPLPILPLYSTIGQDYLPKPLLPALKEIHLDILDCVSKSAEYVDLAQQLAAICPSTLELWMAQVPFPHWNEKELDPIFANFKNLLPIHEKEDMGYPS